MENRPTGTRHKTIKEEDSMLNKLSMGAAVLQ